MSLHPISLESILILFTQLRFDLPRGLFPSGNPTNSPYAFLSHICATCPGHLILLKWLILIILDEVYKLWSSSLCRHLHHSVIYSVFGSNILITLFSVYVPPLMWEKSFTPIQKHRKNYSVACSNLYGLDRKREDKRFWTEWQQALLEFSLLLISSWMEFWFVTVIPKYLNCIIF
jgi:hypothetical protein